MRLSRTEHVAVRRQVRRWVAPLLAVTLAALTAAAVLGSWRQAVIVRTVAADSASTDRYQHATYLAVLENSLLQGSLREPDGEERRAVAEAGRMAVSASLALPARGGEQAERNRRIAELEQGLQPVIARYLTLLDAADSAGAQQVLEDQIEPVAEQILASLLAEQAHEVEHYHASVARAQRDSGQLRLGTLLAFLVGLVVLAVIGRSNRSHRLLIEGMATHDALTGLLNRAAFHACANAALADGGRGRRPPTVLMLDLDGFKEVNDRLGHHTGDLLLVEVGNRLRASVRTQDMVARLGGDEFAILFTDADPIIGETSAARIGEAFNNPFDVGGLVLDIEISIGIVTAEWDNDVAAIIQNADTAMYTAKENRQGYTRFGSGQGHDAASRLILLGDLRRALDVDDEIQLHYQPKISMTTGEMIGAEALARWSHPTRGPVRPDDFIPVLEATSLIHRFTARVLELALAQGRRWLDDGHRVPVAVNVSTRCLLDPRFPDTVAQALEAAGLSGDQLCIEITESTVMADPARAIEVLRRIRALGVRTSVDDFGTGYSSMAYLKILPVDEIKVDRSFVKDMATDNSNYVLVESTVQLGHNLGLAVVAEGVEDAATVAALRAIGCDIAQGYHFARPLAAVDFTDYLTRREAVILD